jgi:hypothetical protein
MSGRDAANNNSTKKQHAENVQAMMMENERAGWLCARCQREVYYM